MNLGSPVSKNSWVKITHKAREILGVVAEQNMKQAVEELKRSTQCEQSSSIQSVGVSFDCSWNSRAWQAKEGIVAATAQGTGKIMDCVYKTSSCPSCANK